MSTHATLGVKFSDERIIGCYVHYDGDTMKNRIEEFLSSNTTTCLSILIARGQASGGMRSFHSPAWDMNPELPPRTDFLDDSKSYIINERNWSDLRKHGVWHSYLVDYESGEIESYHRDS